MITGNCRTAAGVNIGKLSVPHLVKKIPAISCNLNVHYSVHNSDSELLSTAVSGCHILFLFITIHIAIDFFFLL